MAKIFRNTTLKFLKKKQERDNWSGYEYSYRYTYTYTQKKLTFCMVGTSFWAIVRTFNVTTLSQCYLFNLV